MTEQPERTVLVGDTFETPADAEQYARDEADALGDPQPCLNCGATVILCTYDDCAFGSHADVEPRIHVGSGSHYCHTESADNMVAEVRND